MIADGEYVPDLKNISDGQLFALIAAKDDLAHAAYRVLYDRYAQLIWSLCCDAGSKLVRWNKEQFVEELFSQTMIKIRSSNLRSYQRKGFDLDLRHRQKHGIRLAERME